ncbi:helix-turn-helix domain-containing protein [Microvirga sesbaniae]|uniref:helix-turn-helix domain-containing protein n=1 Tax=Microvirga sesbaniae TaxID=681392 RepID=UPI00358DA644
MRERVLGAFKRDDLPQVAIGRRFQVCPGTVLNWHRQEREEGRRALAPDAAVLEVLRQLVIEDNDALLREYRGRLAHRTHPEGRLIRCAGQDREPRINPKSGVHFSRPKL